MQDVTGVPFEQIMESLDDEVLDPVAALSLNLKEPHKWLKRVSFTVTTSYSIHCSLI